MIVYDQTELSPTDKIVYAIVYWFEHMREGICKASNNTIATIARVDDRTVRAALDHLEQVDFIKRYYKDPEKRIRTRITCKAWYPAEKIKEMPGEEQSALPGIPDARPETPRQFSIRFFAGDEAAIGGVIEDIITASEGKMPREALQREIRKFSAYWTEPNGTGTKQLWQTKPTFEVKRRLYNWLGRASVRKTSVGSRAGAGVTL